MFDIQEEFNCLISNGWLTKEEAEKFMSDDNIISCMNCCTSPQKENIFNSLKIVPFQKVKVVILGQDPYPNPNHAHGLAFSSKDTVTPESLKNIFKAIDSAYKSSLFKDAKNELTNWAKQGVLLLNTGLTYQKTDKQSNNKSDILKAQQALQKIHLKAWKPFLKCIIQKILTINEHPVVMLLWGNSAHDIVFANIKDKQFKEVLHDRNPHIVPKTKVMLLQCSHPSPLSVNRGGDFPEVAPIHFKECEKYLGKEKINWTEL